VRRKPTGADKRTALSQAGKAQVPQLNQHSMTMGIGNNSKYIEKFPTSIRLGSYPILVKNPLLMFISKVAFYFQFIC
jgi:hypothetical protein